MSELPLDTWDADVAIIGAGPVGLLLANLLGARGVRTSVFDKRLVAQPSSMAIGITPPSLEIMKPLGLDVVLRDAGIPVRHAEVYEAQTRVGRLDFASIPSDYPFFLSLPQARTVEILRANLAQYPSVTVADGWEFVGLNNEAAGVQFTSRRTNDRQHLAHRAKFLIGADGHRSAVRVAAGVAVREKTYPQRFIMADFKDESQLGSEARLFFTSEASVESFPLPGGERRWIVQLDESHGQQQERALSLSNGPLGQAQGRPEDYLRESVYRLASHDLGRQPAQFVSLFGAKRMVVERYYAGRVVLAGDAAHVMSSIGGQGMNTGFADAEMLAEILPAALQRPEGMRRAFRAYDRVRRHAFEVAATRAERGMWLGTRRGRIASWFRKHFIRDVLFSPFLERYLAPYFAMLTVPYCNLKGVPREWFAADFD